MDRALQARLEKDPVLETATEWFFELRSEDVSGERIAEWQQWLAADAAHREAFEGIETFWQLGQQVQATRWPADQEVAADTYKGVSSISEWRQARPSGLKAPRFALAAAAVVAVLTLGWVGLERWPSIAPMVLGTSMVAVETDIGETRSVRLADGSSVVLGGHSALKANITRSSRDIVLERGEAFFQVAKDPSRRFTVHSGTTSVVAIGTAFNVRRAGERTVVAVAEGVVRVATAESAKRPEVNLEGKTSPAAPRAAYRVIRTASLKAGQQLSVDGAGAAPDLAAVDTSSVAGWRDGRLQYLNEPLATVVADLARYSSREIHVAGEATGELRVTGIVFQQNIDGWLTSLQATLPVDVVREEYGVVRLERRKSASEGGRR